MGREILYCTNCGKRLTADDFTRGRAHTFENRQYCDQCLPKRLEPPPTPRPSKRAPSSARGLPAAAPRASSRAPLITGVAAGVALLVALVVVLSKPAPPAPPPPEDPARALIEKARDIERASPGSPESIRRWEEAVAAGGPSAAEAKRELARVLFVRKEGEEKDLRELDGRARERVEKEQFGAVFDVYEEARKRRSTPEWTKAIDARVQELKATTERLYAELKTKAVAARTKGRESEAAELRTKLAGWGRKDLSDDLDAELAKIVPREEIPAGAAALMRYPASGPPIYGLAGQASKGGLAAVPYQHFAVMGGFEIFRPPFPVPENGEFWLTYSTTSSKPIVLRLRTLKGDKTVPFNWTLQAPEVGRPARVKAPVREFMNYDNKHITAGDLVHSIYIQQDDPKAELIFYETVVFRKN